MRFQSHIFQIVGRGNSFINLQTLLNAHLLNKGPCNNKWQVHAVISKEIRGSCLYICKFIPLKNIIHHLSSCYLIVSSNKGILLASFNEAAS